MTTTEPIESHAVHSQRMLDHAVEMIAQGDRLQASEKIWGAAAHRVKQSRRRAQLAQRAATPTAGRSSNIYRSTDRRSTRSSDLFGARQRRAPKFL